MSITTVAYCNKNLAELRGDDVSLALGKNFLDCPSLQIREKVLDAGKRLRDEPGQVLTREIQLNEKVFELKFYARRQGYPLSLVIIDVEDFIINTTMPLGIWKETVL